MPEALWSLGARPWALIAAALSFSQPLAAASNHSIVVVTDRDSRVNSISREQAADLFLGRIRELGDDVPLLPLDSEDEKLRERFYTEVASMSAIRVKAYWSRLVFSGRGRPPTEIAPDEVKASLAGDRRAVTYLPADQVVPTMKVILELP